MKDKSGFTLIEVIGIIAVLAIILTIAVPKINDYLLVKKEEVFLNNARNILRQLEYDNIDYKTFTISNLALLNLSKIDKNNIDLENSIVFVENDEIYLNLVGKGNYKNMYICGTKNFEKNVIVQNIPCSNIENNN